MGHPGRTAKPGARYPSGRLKPVGRADATTAPALIKRAIEAALRGAGDPRLGTTIGRLRLQRDLTDRQMAAAEAYGRLRGRFDRAMGFPRRSAATVFYEAGKGHSTRELGDRALAALRAEHAALVEHVGPAKAMLDRIILDDAAPLPGEMPRLRAALADLVGWFGIGEGC